MARIIDASIDRPVCPQCRKDDTEVLAAPSEANYWRGVGGCHICLIEFDYRVRLSLKVGDPISCECPSCGFATGTVKTPIKLGWNGGGRVQCGFCSHEFTVNAVVETAPNPNVLQLPRRPKPTSWADMCRANRRRDRS